MGESEGLPSTALDRVVESIEVVHEADVIAEDPFEAEARAKSATNDRLAFMNRVMTRVPFNLVVGHWRMSQAALDDIIRWREPTQVSVYEDDRGRWWVGNLPVEIGDVSGMYGAELAVTHTA